MYGCDEYPPPFCKTLDLDDYGSCDDFNSGTEPLSASCGNGFFMRECKTPSANPALSAAFFVIFIVVAALVLLTLFVGVVTTSMEEASKMQDLEAEMEKKIQEICAGQEVTHEQLEIYRRVFNMLDLDGGGTIDPAELKVGLRCVNIFPSDRELADYVIEIDKNNDGSIDLVEFVVFMTNMKEKNLEERRKREEIKKAASPVKQSLYASIRGRQRVFSTTSEDGSYLDDTGSPSPSKKGFIGRMRDRLGSRDNSVISLESPTPIEPDADDVRKSRIYRPPPMATTNEDEVPVIKSPSQIAAGDDDFPDDISDVSI